jgi:hypothetical protein
MEMRDKMMMTTMGFGRNELAIFDIDFDDFMRVKILRFDLWYLMEFLLLNFACFLYMQVMVLFGLV